MSIPTFVYFQHLAADRGPMPTAFAKALIATGRFHRTARSQILFEVAPGDYVMLVRRADLTTILEAGEVIRITGDELDDNAYAGFWCWLNDRKWMIPRAPASAVA